MPSEVVTSGRSEWVRRGRDASACGNTRCGCTRDRYGLSTSIPFFDISSPNPSCQALPREPFASLGRFSEVGFHILVALADGPKHGYAMMLDIDGMTGTRPGPGTLYAAIARLEQRHWIEPVASDD